MMRLVPPEMQKPIADQVFDLFGLERPRTLAPLAPQMPQGMGQPMPTPTAQGMSTAANTMMG